jgi:hypothetical protein
MLLSVHLAMAATEMPVQQEVDRAFDLILRTQVGKAICRDILGADPDALELHLGISRDHAVTLAGECRGFDASEWIYPTSPADIRKLAIKANKPRRYKLVHSDQAFPIESWTDSITNVTTILVHSKKVPFPRMVQILAHETAVYFDSKAHPLHPGAQDIPHLRGLNLKTEGEMDPLVAISNPMQAHTLTYLRALQVEFAILREMVNKEQIVAPADLDDPYLQYLVSDRCMQACIEELLVNTRAIYMPFSLPLLAFSPHYRALALQELPQVKTGWSEVQWAWAQQSLNVLPVQFMKNQFTGDVVADLSRFFFRDQSKLPLYEQVDHFLSEDLWPVEWRAISGSRFPNGTTLLEFMKRPLLSGYNISLSSGPRVRVRTGNIE